jgi:osmoprotectant transport system substrate-binding protein
VVGLLVALLAACSADGDEPEATARLDALTWMDDTEPALEGVPIAVGSKEGSVDEVLGWIAVETLVAAGADVIDVIDSRGDSRATRDDQLAGLIDLSWETTGTGWLSLLREIGPSADPEQLYQDVRDEDLEENGIVWLRPAPADAGMSIVASPEVAEDLGITMLSELADALDDREEGVVVCVPSGNQALDPAGLAALAEASDVRIRQSVVKPVPNAGLIELTEAGAFCPFTLVDRLDPRLADARVEPLVDDIAAFVAQRPSVTVREDTYDVAPGLDELFAPVSEALDTEALRRLVGRVSEDDEDPRDVARAWLVDEGLAET